MVRRRSWPTKHLGLAIWILGAGVAAATALAEPQFPDEVRAVTLKNGLRLLLAPDPRTPAVDLALWYDSSPRHERPGIVGISHLFEHLMFRGSSRFGPREHQRLLQAQGGTAGAYTAADFLCFYDTVPTGALELTLRLEADRMASLRLTQDGLETERRVVLAENPRRAASSPIARGLDRLYATAFTAHPYRWPVLGLESDLRRITLRECSEYHRARFAPSRTLVTVVGNFDSSQVLAWARRYLEPIAAGRGSDAPRVKEPSGTGERRASAQDAGASRLLLVGWRAPARSDPEWPALALLSTVLTHGSTSRLPRALVEGRRTCARVEGDLEGRRDASLFYVAATARRGADSAEVERGLTAELDKLADEPVTEPELEKAKRQIEASVAFGLQGVRGRAQALGTFQLLNGDYRQLPRYLERLKALTAADLQRAAARHLGRAGRCVVWISPSPDRRAGAARGGPP